MKGPNWSWTKGLLGFLRLGACLARPEGPGRTMPIKLKIIK
jgi:hypothetical protein